MVGEQSVSEYELRQRSGGESEVARLSSRGDMSVCGQEDAGDGCQGIGHPPAFKGKKLCIL